MRGSWRPNRNCNILTPNLWPATLCLSRSPLDPNSIRAPKTPFSRVWLSLPHLVSNSIRSSTQLAWLLSWLSYIIVQRPLDLWNRMFNRHQAEILVMQFTGHSLPVHQSMSVPWAFFTSHGQAKARQPARTYIEKLCADAGYSPDDLPGAMDDRDR